MIYEYHCNECDRDFEEIKIVDERFNVFCCGQRATKLISSSIQTTPDLLWNFTGEFRGQKIEITSKGQYKKVLKEHGLADVTVNEAMSVKKSQAPQNNKLKTLESSIKKKVAKEGLSKHLDGAIKTMVKP